MRIRIITKGYWSLPKFEKIYFGKWMKLKKMKLEEKTAEYSLPEMKIGKTIILESKICKALPKKIIIFCGGKRAVLSRWMGGIYSNLDAKNISEVSKFYDEIAGIYRYHVEPTRKNQLEIFVGYLPKGAKTLDASAGDCTFAKAAGRKLDVWNMDASGKMLALAPKGIKENRKFVASASRIPFEKESFGCIVHTFSNLHSTDRKFFREFWRVLKKGGILLYHPVKSPGEQWPKDIGDKIIYHLRAAGFSKIERKADYAKGKKKTALVFYLAKK